MQVTEQKDYSQRNSKYAPKQVGDFPLSLLMLKCYSLWIQVDMSSFGWLWKQIGNQLEDENYLGLSDPNVESYQVDS